jgi:hypothetical protein
MHRSPNADVFVGRDTRLEAPPAGADPAHCISPPPGSVLTRPTAHEPGSLLSLRGIETSLPVAPQMAAETGLAFSPVGVARLCRAEARTPAS